MQYSDYWAYLVTQVNEDIGVDPSEDHYNEIITDGRFTIHPKRGRNKAVIRALVVEPMDPDVRAERRDYSEQIEDALDADDRDTVIDLMDNQPDPHPPYEERSQWVEYELPEDLAEEAVSAIRTISEIQTVPNAYIEDTDMTGYVDDDDEAHLGVSGRIVRKDDPTGVFDAAARAVAADHDRIPSATAVNSMRVSVGPTDPDRDRSNDEIGGMSPHDYTIYFETSEPHEFWAEPDTFDEYKEQVVENNEDIEPEDIADNETMPVHVHMQTGEHADHIIEGVAARRISDAIRTDEFETAPSQLYLNDEQETVYGHVSYYPPES